MASSPSAPAPSAPAQATPAPSPSPSPSPTPSPSPSPGPASKTPAADESFDRAFADLDDLAAPPTPPEAKSAPKKATPEPSAKEPEPPKSADKPPKPTLDDDDDSGTKDVSTFKTPRDLRKYAEKQAALAEERQAKLAELQEKLKVLEASPKDTHKEEAAVSDRIAKLESQLQEREKELYTVRWEKSPEYKQQFEQPYMDAVGEAYEAVKQLFVVQTNEEGEQTQRPASEADFVGVYRLPYGQAYQKAKELFGDLAPVVMQHYQTVHSAEKKALRAIEEHKGKAAEFEKEQTAKQAVERERMQRAWKSVNDTLVQKYPQWFGPDEADPEGNELLQRGYAAVDPAFNNRDSLTPQQAIALDARIRHQAAAFPRMVHRLKKIEADSKAKISALEKELEGFRNSQPSDGKRPAGAAPAEGVKPWEQALDEM